MNRELRMKNEKLRIGSVIINILLKWMPAVLLVSSVNLNAQSVDTLINEAFRNNPMLKSLNSKIVAFEHNAHSVSAMPPPTLGVEINSFNSFNIWNEALSQNITLSQMFPLGGKLGAMENMAKTNKAVAAGDYDSYKVLLASKIKMSYYSLWQFERNIEIQEKFISLYKELLKSNESLYASNKMNQGDILMLQSEIANYETQLVILRNKKESELFNLNKLLGRDISSGKITVDTEIFTRRENINSQELVDELRSVNPQLRKMDGMILMNKAEINANEKELVPDLMLGAMIMRMPKGMIITGKTDPMMIGKGETELMYGLMASVTLPFAPWSRGRYDSKSMELEARIKSVEYEKLDMERDMVLKVNELLLKLKNQEELISLCKEKVLPLEKDNLELQKSLFRNNSVNLNSVIEANKMLLMNEMNLIMATADYQMASAELDMMVGKKYLKN